MAQISGNLTKPDGTPIAGAVITFTSSINSYDVVRRVQVTATTGSNGSYSAVVAIGVYAVSIAYTSGLVTPIGVIVVTLDSGDATLNDYLLKNYDASYVTDVLTRLAQPGGVGLVNGALNKDMNLNDVADKVAARVNLDVYNKAEVEAAIEAGGGGEASALLRKDQNLNDLADKTTARSNLDVYSKEQTDDAIAAGTGGDLSGLMVKTQNLNDVDSKPQARLNLDVYSKEETQELIPSPVDISGKLDKASNLSDLASAPAARSNLDVFSKAESQALIPAPIDISGKLDKSQNLADLLSESTARTNLDVYSKAEVAGLIPAPVDISGKMDKTSNLNDLSDKAAARTNLDVYSKEDIGQISGGFMNVIGTFSAGVTLTSYHTLITDGRRVYQWDGSYNKVVPANSTPETTGGYGVGGWSVIGDAAYRTELASSDGFRYVGQASSFAALRTIIPTSVGQSILLESYADKSDEASWAALSRSPKGGGRFVAIGAAGTDDGGSIAAVNDVWHWRRVVDTYYTPEMFGAGGYGDTDDTAAIIAAMTASRNYGLDDVRGEGIYLISSTIPLYMGLHASPSGLLARGGFSLWLNALIVDSTKWPALPETWWDAAPAFRATTGCEGIRLHVEQFDGAGVASFVDTIGGSLGTSHVHVGYARNFIIMYRNYMNVAGQGTMNKITGENWQDGYQGVLLGSGIGGQNSECHMIDVNWLANNRFGGVMLQDRTQYSHIKAGTFDFNGKWLSALTLTDISANSGNEVAYGSAITNGTITRYAMSSVMNNDGTEILVIAENSERLNGTSDFVVGDTVSFDGWTATVSGIETASNGAVPFYFDIIISNRTGDFSKCLVTATYLGGWKGHNKFTNDVICNNSTETIGSINIRGLGIDGGQNSSFWYLNHLYGGNQVFGFYNNNMTIGQPVELGDNALWGQKIALSVAANTITPVLSFSPAASGLYPKSYNVTVQTSIAAQWAYAVVRVDDTSVTVTQLAGGEFITLGTDEGTFDLNINLSGAPAIVTVSMQRTM